jgi:outer membrane lipoprotein-sorting protein
MNLNLDGTTLRMRDQSQLNRPWRSPRATLVALATASALAMICAPALAETVPLPRPAPKDRAGPAKPAIGDITGTPLVGTPPPVAQLPPTPILPDPRMRNATDNGVFDAGQRAQATRISGYLSGLSTLVGNFVQVAPNGNRTTGEFYMQKPGKVRFAYDQPNPIDIVSDGTSVVVRDRKLETQDIYPLSQTPLRYLLSDRIDLLKDTNVVSIAADDVFVTVTIEEKGVMGTQRLMLMVGAKDNQLKQWTLTDPQGYDTTVAVYNLNTQKKPDPDLFKIDFTNYDQGRGG